MEEKMISDSLNHNEAPILNGAKNKHIKVVFPDFQVIHGHTLTRNALRILVIVNVFVIFCMLMIGAWSFQKACEKGTEQEAKLSYKEKADFHPNFLPTA